MKPFALLLLLFFSIPLPAATKPQSASDLAATRGYVFVSFPKGGPADMLTVQSSADKKEYTLNLRPNDGKSAFGLWLPAGEYRIAKWREYPWGDYQTFNVVAGRITDLGSLVVFSVGGYQVVVLPVRHPEVAHDVDAAVAEFRQYLASAELVQWRPITPPRPIDTGAARSGLGLIGDLIIEYDRHRNEPAFNSQLRAAATIEDFYRLAIGASAPTIDEAAIDDAGNYYYATDLGQVRVRHADGIWTALDTGTLHNLMAVEVRGDLMLASSDNGVLRASNDAGGRWRVLKSMPENEPMVDIDWVAGRWLVTTASGYRRAAPSGYVCDILRIYEARADDFSDLRQLKELALNPKLMNVGWFGPRNEAAGHFYYVTAVPALHRLDLDSMQWQTITPPTEVYGFHAAAATGMLAAFKPMGAFSKLFVSEDHGATWQKRTPPPYAILNLGFESAQSGWAARWNASAFGGAIETLDYDALTKQWQKTGEAPQGCVHVLRDPAGTPRFCVTTAGSILARKGKLWSVEFAAD